MLLRHSIFIALSSHLNDIHQEQRFPWVHGVLSNGCVIGFIRSSWSIITCCVLLGKFLPKSWISVVFSPSRFVLPDTRIQIVCSQASPRFWCLTKLYEIRDFCIGWAWRGRREVVISRNFRLHYEIFPMATLSAIFLEGLSLRFFDTFWYIRWASRAVVDVCFWNVSGILSSLGYVPEGSVVFWDSIDAEVAWQFFVTRF